MRSTLNILKHYIKAMYYYWYLTCFSMTTGIDLKIHPKLVWFYNKRGIITTLGSPHGERFSRGPGYLWPWTQWAPNDRMVPHTGPFDIRSSGPSQLAAGWLKFSTTTKGHQLTSAWILTSIRKWMKYENHHLSPAPWLDTEKYLLQS